MPDFTGKKVIVSMGREDDCKEFWHLIKCLYLIPGKSAGGDAVYHRGRFFFRI